MNVVTKFLNALFQLDWPGSGESSMVSAASSSPTSYYDGDAHPSYMGQSNPGAYGRGPGIGYGGQVLIPGQGADPFSWLGYFLATGRQLHSPVSNAFITRRDTGYYHYERQSSFFTCAVAAAYAGAFGKESIEDQRFSPSMAKWRLSNLIGTDLDQVIVTGPTGRTQGILDEMIALMDTDKWSRAGIAEWLYSQSPQQSGYDGGQQYVETPGDGQYGGQAYVEVADTSGQGQ